MSSRKASVCFVAPAVWPVLSEDSGSQVVGGAEVQQSFLARGFTRAGYHVSVVSLDYGQQDAVDIDGVRVYKAHTPNGGVPVARFIHPRVTSLWHAMTRANADIYYQRSGGMLTGLVAHYCRMHRRKMIYAAAHDADFERRLPLIRFSRDRWLFRYGLRYADHIVVQSHAQQAACMALIGRTSTRVPSCYEAPISACSDSHGYILWVSTVRSWKRPEVFLELARALPNHRFRMVGGPAIDEPRLYRNVEARARALRNIDFLGFVPYSRIEREFDGAVMLINTSSQEGFPNTFLQAWSRGIPTVSFLSSALTDMRCCGNLSVRTVTELAECVQRLSLDANYYRECSNECRRVFLANHSVAAAIAAYETLFELLKNSNQHGA